MYLRWPIFDAVRYHHNVYIILTNIIYYYLRTYLKNLIFVHFYPILMVSSYNNIIYREKKLLRTFRSLLGTLILYVITLIQIVNMISVVRKYFGIIKINIVLHTVVIRCKLLNFTDTYDRVIEFIGENCKNDSGLTDNHIVSRYKMRSMLTVRYKIKTIIT